MHTSGLSCKIEFSGTYYCCLSFFLLTFAFPLLSIEIDCQLWNTRESRGHVILESPVVDTVVGAVITPVVPRVSNSGCQVGVSRDGDVGTGDVGPGVDIEIVKGR